MAQSMSAEKVKNKVKESIGRVMPSSGVEGNLTKKIEEQTSRLPSLGYLGLAIGSMAFSAVLAFATDERRKPLANFVGLWAPTFLILGIYNKLVKIEGSERFNEEYEDHEEGKGNGHTEAA